MDEHKYAREKYEHDHPIHTEHPFKGPDYATMAKFLLIGLLLVAIALVCGFGANFVIFY